MIPALIATIGAIRRSHLLLMTAGALAIVQSFIAFSGITLPFLVPASLLLVLGAEGRAMPLRRRALFGGVLVLVLGVAAWVAPFALAETTCWVARAASDGTVVYAPIPVSDTLTVGSNEIASGCDGGTLTMQGVALAAVLGIGAVSMAMLVSGVPPRRRLRELERV